ncbi:hypothetical protein CHLRE_16g694750v5 [Chlamydomonas reinhardtii]|uniref:Glycosyl transferase CAP10 domain-containing protein n=1 Tax=Chlamydomonas reinhardtii TaxID=3055 RepID=A0A2K3CSD9_CHLRE|nr:uncharacterized protein CHLRE_16g694750v5 [Chlamydomonas reinhardtii]PNW71171.1 hypothetical protein CHLRE_16g694750v5 [Chlamydomonas reinhardtii]
MRGMHHALRGVVLLLACFASNLPPATARYQAKPPPEFCDQYEAVYKSIDQDLELYRNNGGITPELMARTMSLHTAGNREKGLAVGFYNGRVYVIDTVRRMKLKPFGHHVTLWTAYLKVMLDLQQRFGAHLPNAEFVWHTIDRPVRLTNASAGARDNYPVFRFGKSAAHPDILIPNFHFYMKAYQRKFLDKIKAFNRDTPWPDRAPLAVARFSAYGRYVHPRDPHCQRLGAGGAALCKVTGRSTAICPVRQHLHEWANAHHRDRLDVSKDRLMPMDHHARYKYLLHVDGQGLSSKLEFLLTMGSLVLKEDSGYRAYYHHLLEPGVHFLPVWKNGAGPEDILEAVDWARQHDQQAHRIALAGQQLAARYLTSEARACFWLRLFQAYAATLTYDPVQYRNITFSAEGEREGRGEEAVAAAGLRFLKPVARFIEEDVATTFPLLLSELEWEP